ncbi:MAG: hypothetical protein IT276_01470 [Ignavibacteriaceae bacterium]|nr:hypothetical protein [Ignavibacterium sp.]MCC6253561.1 hypothetical protein [Ignavibacteriaceae bacterium]HRN25052.1 hypothetical protein [Ignavibacteriaceae bacterium]HRP91745.1 hypothetical protein [Ignavibacteriaceae bacterium]HRQ52917.1 hypothetical protein [Ignavibacteriaceae bacterium]
MKHFTLLGIIILLFLFSSISFSQYALNTGNYSLSGSVLYSHSKNTSSNQVSDYESKMDNFLFSPDFGIFIIDNLLISGNVSFSYNEINTQSTYRDFTGNPVILKNKNIRRYLTLGPTIRYYFDNLKILPFVETAYNYSKALGSDQYGHIFSFAGGINYFISTSVALEPFIGYSISTYKNPNQDSNTFSVGIRVNYFIVKNQ